MFLSTVSASSASDPSSSALEVGQGQCFDSCVTTPVLGSHAMEYGMKSGVCHQLLICYWARRYVYCGSKHDVDGSCNAADRRSIGRKNVILAERSARKESPLNDVRTYSCPLYIWRTPASILRRLVNP